MTWVTNEQPFGVNHAPLLSGLASDGSGAEVPVAVDKDTGELLVSGGGGSGGGTSSTFGATFPTTGTAVGATDGTLMQPLKVDGSDNLLTKINAALPAGANVIGHVITDTGSTTAVTGTIAVTQSGTWNVGSSSVVGSAVPANAFYLGVMNSAGNLSGVSDIEQASDGNNGIGTIATGIRLYNGSTWDRLRGDSTNGAWVNVKAAVTPVSATIINGQQSVTATAVALASHTVTQSLTIEALSTNTISVFVGATGVTTGTGIELPPGAAVTLPVSNSNVAFVIASTTGATVTYIGV